MARRYIGDAVIHIEYDDETEAYRGTVVANGHAWKFDQLKRARILMQGEGSAVDSSRAYDSMAASAVSFGGYFTTHNRGDGLPDWSPPASVADAINEATQLETDEEGKGLYFVKRTPKGPGRWTP